MRARAACLFRPDAGPEIGFGHLKRCLALAHEVRRRGVETAFFLPQRLESAVSEISRAGHPVVDAFDGSRFDTIVADMAHRATFEAAPAVNQTFGAWRAAGTEVVVIDGLGADSIYARVRPVEADLLVVPYAGAETVQWTLPARSRVLAGPAYFILGESYVAATKQPRSVRPAVSRVLVTFGGSDPKRGTLLALNALAAVKTAPLEVYVVVGQGFSASLEAEVRKTTDRIPHRLTIVDRPDDLAGEMRNCDLAISSAGLTKYELAVTGTPSIQLELDDERATAGAAFAALGTAWNLGTMDRVSPQELAGTVERLMGDLAARRSMSDAGRRVADGRGAQRIIEAMRLNPHA